MPILTQHFCFRVANRKHNKKKTLRLHIISRNDHGLASGKRHPSLYYLLTFYIYLPTLSGILYLPPHSQRPTTHQRRPWQHTLLLVLLDKDPWTVSESLDHGAPDLEVKRCISLFCIYRVVFLTAPAPP